jgi:hypothetical protein
VAVHRIPVDRLLGVGIDECLVKKVQAEVGPGQLGAHHELDGNKHHDAKDAEGAKHHQPMEAAICNGRVATAQQEGANLGNLARSILRWPLFAGSAGLGQRLSV